MSINYMIFPIKINLMESQHLKTDFYFVRRLQLQCRALWMQKQPLGNLYTRPMQEEAPITLLVSQFDSRSHENILRFGLCLSCLCASKLKIWIVLVIGVSLSMFAGNLLVNEQSNYSCNTCFKLGCMTVELSQLWVLICCDSLFVPSI